MPPPTSMDIKPPWNKYDPLHLPTLPSERPPEENRDIRIKTMFNDQELTIYYTPIFYLKSRLKPGPLQDQPRINEPLHHATTNIIQPTKKNLP